MVWECKGLLVLNCDSMCMQTAGLEKIRLFGTELSPSSANERHQDWGGGERSAGSDNPTATDDIGGQKWRWTVGGRL